MGALINITLKLERRLGNTGLGVIAGIIFFLSATGAATNWDTASSVSPAVPSSSTTTVAESTTVSPTTATTLSTTTSAAAASTTLTTLAARNGLDGYAAVNFTVKPAKDPAKKWCGLLASSASQQASGLMNHSDLGGYDAMIFPFQNDTTAAFYMANVPVALSVAWFDKDGKFVSSADMEPCKTEASKCQLYKPSGAYRSAVEVLKGGLGNLGIGSGSTLSIGASGPC